MCGKRMKKQKLARDGYGVGISQVRGINIFRSYISKSFCYEGKRRNNEAPNTMSGKKKKMHIRGMALYKIK